MRLLLDTHVWLWMIAAPERLGPQLTDHLTDEANDLYLSAVAVWELAIKHAAGKLRFVGNPAVLVPMHIGRSGVTPLGVTVDHALAAAALPMHHRDPFDRMMVAQALSDELTLVTTDDQLAAYGVPLMEATS